MSTRVVTVSAADAGAALAAVLRGQLGLSWAEARRLIGAGRVRVNGAPCTDPARKLRRGQRIQVQKPERHKPRPAAHPTGPTPVIRFADAHLVVVEKPAGLTTMRHAHEAAEFGARGRRFLPPTLADLLPELLARGGKRPRVRAVHRLDRETSGLVVFALTGEAESHLGRQFRAHTVERTYLALVRGRPSSGRIESYLVEDRGDGRRGSTVEPGQGKRAVTHVRVVEELGAYALVECRLETGRTHQVRIHLGEAGAPLCGEHVYDRPRDGKPLPDGSGATRPTLHAATLAFEHPATKKRVAWAATMPKDMRALLQRLRR